MKQIHYLSIFFISLLLLGASNTFADSDLSNLPQYTPTKLSSPNLSSIGSDSMDDLVRLWVKTYKEYQPNAAVQVVSRGSATAPAALIDGSADLGPMARPMKQVERDAFLRRYGFQPTEIKTAYSAVSIYVPKTNPIDSISLAQLDGIFSIEQKRGMEKPITNWSQLGIKGRLGGSKIVPLGRLKNDPTSLYFRQRVNLQGDFIDNLMTTTDLSSLIKSISSTPESIGFGEYVVNNTAVKTLRVSRSQEAKSVSPNFKTIMAGDYPLSRSLNVYIVRNPGESVDSSLQDFLRFVLSQQGQRIVEGQGLVPLSAKVVKEELAKLN